MDIKSARGTMYQIWQLFVICKYFTLILLCHYDFDILKLYL